GIFCLDALDFLEGVVLGMAFDENQFGSGAHFGSAEDSGLDVAGFVASGNHDRTAVGAEVDGKWQRAGDDECGEAKMLEKRGEPAVEERGKKGGAKRPEDAGVGAH